MKRLSGFLLLIPFIYIFTVTASAQQTPQQGGVLSAEEAKQANNPLASEKTVNLQNDVMPSLHGLPDVTLNSLDIRYAQPIGRFFVHASIPTHNQIGSGYLPQIGIRRLHPFWNIYVP